MQVQSVLIVEDEPFNAEFIKRVLKNNNITNVTIVDNASDAISVIKQNEISIVFMDINIKGGVDGITCAKKIQFIKQTPIIFISALNDNEVLKEAIDNNTITYILKPFGEAEILIALKVFENKDKVAFPSDNDVVYFQDSFRYCMKSSTLSCDNRVVALTVKEIKMLEYFVKNLDQVVTTEQISAHLWPQKEVSQSGIRELLVRIRKKIPHLQISTAYGLGYILKR